MKFFVCCWVGELSKHRVIPRQQPVLSCVGLLADNYGLDQIGTNIAIDIFFLLFLCALLLELPQP